ncbi:MAG: aminotransferase class V-fold PLP-dependent enzyme [Bacteroidales bacterium]|jgi:selenocysteine lyase/cysteine desulfurase|nr:aminotransferase class V-fold PLP-dependent enzyme [Bacteroidales bacterium]
MNNEHDLQQYFRKFRDNIIGIDAHYMTPYGEKKLVYFDWIASGRLYRPVEERISDIIGPFVANTHTETSESGSRMTWAYHHAQKLIKEHVNAGPGDVIITAGPGMTTVVNKLQRILGLKGCNSRNSGECLKNADRPVVFLTHMEHHSNQTSWYETYADVVVLEPDENLLVCPENLRKELRRHEDRKFKIGSFTACSNVTGVTTPYHELARIMHEHGGICFIDFAASAPYHDIDMHPADPMEKLDGIFFSPHKFLGGPGSSGVLIFDSSLYKSEVPDQPGGGTVDWTNPWGEYKYADDIEVREDGGTPGFLQAIRAALAIELKNRMGTAPMKRREDHLLEKTFRGLQSIEGVHILAGNVTDRLGVVSFYLEDVHYNLVVRLLSDRYGIQVRGGCACAGTYGHFLLEVSYEQSRKITRKISEGDLSEKPGWIRLSLHPTMTDDELDLFLEAVREISVNAHDWGKDYVYYPRANEYIHRNDSGESAAIVRSWFKL